MLGFSEEEKQRIGLAQQGAGGKGVVRGVFGLPGRLVGGILGGSPAAGNPADVASDNQVNSFLSCNIILFSHFVTKYYMSFKLTICIL